MSQQIYELLSKAAKDVGVVGKGKRNQQQGYNFRSVDDVVDACHAAFTKHGIFLTSEVLSGNREERKTAKGGVLVYSILRIKFTFYAPDGSSVSSTAEGEGMDSGDKASNKAMSAALKYALGQTLLIPFSVTDSENDSPELAPREAKPRKAAKPAPPPALDEDTVLDGALWKQLPFAGKAVKDLTVEEYDGLLRNLRARFSKATDANDTPWVWFFSRSIDNVTAVVEARGLELPPF